jgi:D-alanyl-D-alanine carboxypeptidase (penicillin-binding protein 5/6)
MRKTGRLAASTVTAGLVAGLIVAAGPATRAAASERTQAPDATSKTPAGVRAPFAELADETTGADLWSRSSVSEHPMGSIAKVMTAYVVIAAGDLNRVITVPSGIIGYDNAYGASTAGLVPGEKLTALQLLYALLLPSGCDAAYTLATAYGQGGSRPSSPR